MQLTAMRYVTTDDKIDSNFPIHLVSWGYLHRRPTYSTRHTVAMFAYFPGVLAVFGSLYTVGFNVGNTALNLSGWT
jgi:hypothetical protein